LKENAACIFAFGSTHTLPKQSALLMMGMRQGYLLKNHPDGDVWQTDKWAGWHGHVDFTNPAARQWFW